MTSRAAGLSKSEIQALRSALQASQTENKQLKAENKALKTALQKLGSRSASQQRQARRSVQGQQVKSAVHKPSASKIRIKTPKVDPERLQKETIKKARDARKEMIKKMSGDQRRQYYMNTLYLPQFIERLDNFFGVSGKFSDEQKQLLRQVLPRFTKEQLETVIRDNLGLETIMYESEGNYSYDDINENLDANDIFGEIMDTAKDLGLLTEAELLFINKLVDRGFSTEEAQSTVMKFHDIAEATKTEREEIHARLDKILNK